MSKDILDYFKKNSQFINWDRISSNESIPFSFFEENLDKINWYRLGSNKNITPLF